MTSRTKLTATAIGVLAIVICLGSAPLGGAALTVPAKKKCKIVVKIIHHKKKRVRVCHTVEPKPPKPPHPTPPPPPPPPPQAGELVGSVSLGTDPGLAVMTLAAGDGAVWATTANNSIIRIDPVSMKVVAKIDDPLQAEWAPGVAVGLGSVWLANAIPAIDADPQGGALMRIDEGTNKIVSTVPVGRSPEGIAFTASSVWTANHRSDEVEGAPSPHTFSVSRVDLGSSMETRVAVEHRPDLFDSWSNFCCGPQGITAAFGSVWVGDPTSNAVYRIDPQTNRVVATIAAPESATTCGDLTADAVAVWVASGCDGTMLWRIDPATNTAVPSVVFPTTPGSLRAGFGSIWALAGDALARIDPKTNAVIAENTVSDAGPLDVGEGAVWVATGSTVLKIRPK